MSNFTEGSQPIEERKQITLLKPESEGAINRYTADAETDIVLGFETGAATMTKSDDEKDLVFTFTDANNNIIATIIIEGFYDIYSADTLPTFLIPDGTDFIELAAEDFFLGNDELMPAAGNESQQANDHLGSDPVDPTLLSGLGDGLSALERRSTTQSIQASDTNRDDLSDDDQSVGDTNDLPVADVVSQSIVYPGDYGKLIDIVSDEGLVRNYDFTSSFSTNHDYGNDGAATNDSLVTTYALSLSGNGVPSGITVDINGTPENILLFEVNGEIVGKLSESATDIYFKLSTDENGQLIVTEYKSTNGGGLNSNLITLTRTDLITDGNGDTSSDSASIEIPDNISFAMNVKTSGTQGDDVYYSDEAVTDTKLSTGAGGDFVKIVSESAGIHSSVANNNSTINTGVDNDTVIIDVKSNAMLSTSIGSVSTINTGADDDNVILNAGNHTMHAGGNGKNLITTGDDADSVTLDADRIAMSAVNNGKNEINTGADADKVSITARDNAMSADGNNSTNFIFLEGGDDDLRIVGDFSATNNGINKISGGENDDFIFIDGEFSATGGGQNIINGGKDDDLIKLTASGLTFENVLTVNAGDGSTDSKDDMDILLTGVNNLQAVKDGLTAGAITNVEIAIAGDVNGESVDEVLAALGLDQDGDGKVQASELVGWTKNSNIATDANGIGYDQYTNDDGIVLLIQAGVIQS